MAQQNVTKEEVANLITELVKTIKNSGRQFSTVVGIERGGVHISKVVADCLKIRHTTVKISHYTNQELRESPTIVKNGFDLHQYASCLVVDDLIDSGRTIESFKKTFGWRNKRDCFAVLFSPKNCTADFYVREKPESYLVFPWEKSCDGS